MLLKEQRKPRIHADNMFPCGSSFDPGQNTLYMIFCAKTLVSLSFCYCSACWFCICLWWIVSRGLLCSSRNGAKRNLPKLTFCLKSESCAPCTACIGDYYSGFQGFSTLVGLARIAYIYAPCMTVHMVISLPKILYIHRTMYIYGSGQPYTLVMQLLCCWQCVTHL